jgi:hypothetical protein
VERDLQQLLSLAVEQMRAGKLPREPSASLFAGPGRNSRCALCEDAITPTDVEYELDSTKPGSPQPLHFHRACYFAWLQACE